MNKNILNALLAGSFTLALVSCGENTWNDHYLDGFEGGVDYNSSEEGSYTLTESDYSSIASLMTGKATTDEQKAAAKAIGTNHYFDKTGPFPASVALPAFFETSDFPYYLASNGSTVDVVYAEAAEVPAELTALAASLAYTVSTDNYKAVWESDEDYIKAFAPVNPASKYLPGILTEALPDAAEGNYAVVTYDEASTNPVFNKADDAPKVYINEPFTESMGDFTMENVLLPTGSTYVWSFDTRGYMKASGYVSGKNCDSEGWLISPEVNLSANANAVLTYEQAWNYFTSVDVAKEEATVSVREKGGKWVQLTVPTVPEKMGWTFVNSGNIDLSAYNGKTIQIGFCYKSTATKAGTLEVRNVVLQDGANVAARSRSLAAEVPSESKNAVYYFDGKAWSLAEGVAVLNPADYTAMGVSNNKLVDPEIFIPMYLKTKLPYAQSGDQEYVVYNKNKADLFVFDGVNWALNNNGLETVTGRFAKANGAWKFSKYIGKATFSAFEMDQIELDRSYLMVSGNICATVIDKNSNYGYLLTTPVTISGTSIVMKSDANAFLFASSATIDGTVIKAPEGKFLIKDSYDRYLYRSGTYSSANVSKTPAVDGGQIKDAYLWTATRNADGTWAITCDLGDGNVRSFYYSSSYSNFAVYASASATDVFPTLFQLDN
ncbi:MAG: choice-of-anchor J domain-containing protein [Duncaniella sp.]|nr:choice-of-anchor J domain-containing protein [Muribaculum sp.]MCM1256088.1 choice-of-anchor J domain-containing protein [Duncaniella sp.]